MMCAVAAGKRKDPNYLLCYNCKKKFKVPQQNKEAEQRNTLIFRRRKCGEKRETEMRKAYDDLLSIEEDKRKNLLRSRRNVRNLMTMTIMMICMMKRRYRKRRLLFLPLPSLW